MTLYTYQSFTLGSYTFTDLILQQAKDTSFRFGVRARTRDCLGCYSLARYKFSHTYIHIHTLNMPHVSELLICYECWMPFPLCEGMRCTNWIVFEVRCAPSVIKVCAWCFCDPSGALCCPLYIVVMRRSWLKFQLQIHLNVNSNANPTLMVYKRKFLVVLCLINGWNRSHVLLRLLTTFAEMTGLLL